MTWPLISSPFEQVGHRSGKGSAPQSANQKVPGSSVFHDTIEAFVIDLEQFDLESLDGAIRWTHHHFTLRKRDGVVLRFNNTRQLEEDMP